MIIVQTKKGAIFCLQCGWGRFGFGKTAAAAILLYHLSLFGSIFRWSRDDEGSELFSFSKKTEQLEGRGVSERN